MVGPIYMLRHLLWSKIENCSDDDLFKIEARNGVLGSTIFLLLNPLQSEKIHLSIKVLISLKSQSVLKCLIKVESIKGKGTVISLGS